MSIQDSKNGDEFVPQDSMEITDPKVITLFQHPVKLILLENLYQISKTIMQLHKNTGYNPGTVKRHLKDLEAAGLIVKAKQEMSEKKILMTYYRVSAMEFIFQYRWPPQ